MTKDANFFSEMKSFPQFEDFTTDGHYEKLPKGWVVFVTDIQGSTKAIEEGRYKDVNLIGAATISVCQSVMGKESFPFVFGGDGASLCIPSQKQAALSEGLSQLKNLSEKNYQLKLRVACIPIEDIENQSAHIEVAKFEITQGQSIAMFRGGGLAVADRLAKQHYEKYAVKDSADIPTQLDGLSCRWEPIPSKKDKILSLLVMARAKPANAIYTKVMTEIKNILGTSIEAANPVQIEKMSYKSFGKMLKDELRARKSFFDKHFLINCIELIICFLVFRIKVPQIFFDFETYKQSMASHSDFRKFDDTLRMIIDCTEKERLQIIKTLEGLHQAEQIYYGTHVSAEALMTCLVKSTKQGEHIHFIDGGDGGYALAAKQMKGQMT